MKAKSTWPNESTEVGVITFEGNEHTALGACWDGDHATGYPDIESGEMRSWEGKKIGTCRVVARWRTPRSFVSSHMYQIEATIGGVRYTGRGGGSSLLWKGRKKRT